MKRILITSVAFLALTSTLFASSYEPFADASGNGGTTYIGGSPLFGQTNALGEGWAKWTGGTATNTVLVVSSNLVYSNFPAALPAPKGNAVQVPTGTTAPGGLGAALTLSNPVGPDPALKATNKVFISFLMQVPNTVGLGGGVYWAGLVQSSQAGTQSFALPPSHAFKLFIETNAANGAYSIGPADNGGSGNAAYDAGGHQPGDVLFVVVDYEFGTNSTGANDTCHLWINPVASSFGLGNAPTPTTSHGIAAGNNLTNAAAFYLLARNAATMPANGIVMDELRIGRSWSYVTGGPDVAIPPINSTNTPGTTATFTAKAAPDAAHNPLTYQWQLNGFNLVDGGNISGATTTNLTVANVTSATAGIYTFVVSSALGTASANAVLAVDPTILTQPANQQTPHLGNATFAVTATTVAPPLTYQWQENGVNVTDGTSASGTVFSGSQSNVLSLSNIAVSDGGATFICIIVNHNANTVTSTGATLTIIDPGFITTTRNVTTNYGGSASFAVTVGGTGPFSYQWSFNGNPLFDGTAGDGSTISGSQSSTLQLTGLAFAESGLYSVTVNGTDGSITNAATLNVIDPYIVTQPAPQTVTNGFGQTATFSVTANGTPSLAYQWLQNGVALTDSGNVSGSTTPTLTVVSPVDANAGSYTVSITGGSGTNIVSTPVALTVLDPVVVTSPLQSRLERAGDNLSFVIGVAATAPVFHWYKDGTLITTATSSNLSFTNVQLSNAGTYTVVVSNVFNIISNSATLSVTNQYLALATNNLVVARVGDGAQRLNVTNGNTLYLDQFQPNGGYVSTIMISNSGPASFIVEGGSPDAAFESVLTLSTNQNYLNFAGYNLALPNSNTSFLGGGAAATNGVARAIGAVNALGFYTLCLTNTGLYSVGVQMRSAVSTDGVSNFWTTGSGGGGIKYLNPTTSPSTIPQVIGLTDPRVVGIYNGNLYFTSGAQSIGLFNFSGLPLVPSSPGVIIFPSGNSPTDFAISPDGTTIYIADDSSIANGGGIQRWDNGGFVYTLATGTNSTVGARGLTVDFSNFSNGTGAVVYATTAENSGNRLIAITDNGSSSPATVLSTAGPNQLYRGIRFGPAIAPLVIAAQPQNVDAFVGNTVGFRVGVTGDAPYSYQWQFNGTNINNATNSVLVVTNIQAANVGGYSVIVSNPLTNVVSVSAQLQLSTFSVNGNLAGYWKLDDGSGTVAMDSSTNADNGNLLNFPGDNSEWVPGRSSGALNFANVNTLSNNVVEVADIPALNFDTSPSFSLAAWVKTSTNRIGSGAIVAKGYGNGGEQYVMDVFNSTFRFFVRNSTLQAISCFTPIAPNNRWQHVVATFDAGANIMKFYVNGQLVGSTNAPLDLQPTSVPLSIGNRKSSSAAADYDLTFPGIVDDVRVYNLALGAADVQTLYTLFPGLAPVFYGNPVGGTVYTGFPFTFAPSVDGTDPLTYQWAKNSVLISGATNATLTLNSVKPSDAGGYTLLVSNAFGTNLSSAAVLQVTPFAISGVSHLSDGTVQLSEVGPPNATYRIYASTNVRLPLAQWTVIGTNTFDGNGMSTFTDLNATNNAGEFYRISIP